MLYHTEAAYRCLILDIDFEVAKFCIAKNKRLINAFTFICLYPSALPTSGSADCIRCKFNNNLHIFQK